MFFINNIPTVRDCNDFVVSLTVKNSTMQVSYKFRGKLPLAVRGTSYELISQSVARVMTAWAVCEVNDLKDWHSLCVPTSGDLRMHQAKVESFANHLASSAVTAYKAQRNKKTFSFH